MRLIQIAGAQPARYLNLGSPSHKCQFCDAIMWYEERLQKTHGTANPMFSLCCIEGKVKLPKLKEAPIYLQELLDYRKGQTAAKFRDNIRSYNSIFSFTSMGANIEKEINRKPGPYVFRINGENYHMIRSLLPKQNDKPKFAQLYIFDTENEVRNRLQTLGKSDKSSKLDEEIVEGLMHMFDNYNALTKVF